MDNNRWTHTDAIELSEKGAIARVQALFLALALIAAGGAFWLMAPGTTPDRPATRLVLDANTAPIEVLAALPTLGPARLAAIEAARTATPFVSLDDLERRVKGIGPASAAELAPNLRFGPELHQR